MAHVVRLALTAPEECTSNNRAADIPIFLCEVLKNEIHEIVTSGNRRSDNFAAVRELYPAGVAIARQLLMETVNATDFNEVYIADLHRVVNQVGLLATIRSQYGTSDEPPMARLGSSSSNRPITQAASVQTEGGRATQVPAETGLAEAARACRAAEALVAEWRTSKSKAKNFPGYDIFAAALVSGDESSALAGISKPEARDVVSVLIKLHGYTVEGRSGAEVKTIIANVTRRLATLQQEYAAATMTIKGASRRSLPPFPEFRFSAAIRYIRRNRQAVINAVSGFQFGGSNTIQLKRLLESLEEDSS